MKKFSLVDLSQIRGTEQEIEAREAIRIVNLMLASDGPDSEAGQFAKSELKRLSEVRPNIGFTVYVYMALSKGKQITVKP